jgi:hypothetical protein
MADDNELEGILPPEEPKTPIGEPDDETSQEPSEETPLDEGEEGEEEEAEIETIEVEINGKKYLVPKDVEPHLLREEDYTQKTQTLAEQRRQVEDYQKQLVEKAALHEAVIDDISIIKGMDSQLAEYAKIDWPQYMLQDAKAAQYHYMQYQQLHGFRQQAAQSVSEKMQHVSELQAKSRDEAIARTIAALEKPDPDYLWPGFSEAHMSKLTVLSKKYFGLTDAEQANMTSPKSIKILNEAVMSRELRKAAQVPRLKAPEAQPVKQIPTNRGVRTTSSSGDHLTADQWRAKEEARQAKKRAALNGRSLMRT